MTLTRVQMISKSMSYLLRHGALKEGVPILPNGKMKVQALLDWLNSKGKGQDRDVTHDDIMEVIQEDQKSRYSYDPVEDLIWAAQGHSMDLHVEMQQWNVDGLLIHVSYIVHKDSISNNGLKRMSRQHIHMISTNDPSSWDLVRKDANMYVLVDVKEARERGIVFYQADNGVILSEGIDGTIPPDLLTLIEAPRKTGCYGFIVTAKDSVLMVQTKAGYWGFPKGKRKKGEHSLQCAFRELHEETGLSPQRLSLLPDTKAEINDKGNCPTVYFRAVLDNLEPVRCLDLDEDLKTCWLSREEIAKLSGIEFVERRRSLID